MLAITQFITRTGHKSFYGEKWRTLIEDHIDYLKEHPDTTILEVSPMAAYQYKHNFFGVLTDHAIPEQFHWAIMRINGFYSSDEFTEDVRNLYIPASEVLSKLNTFIATS